MYDFVAASIEHPLHLGLMTHEAARPSSRLVYIFDTYIEPSLNRLDGYLRALRAENRIRRLTLRSLFMLVAHGAVAPYSLNGLSARFDTYDGSFDPHNHAREVTDLIVAGLALRLDG